MTIPVWVLFITPAPARAVPIITVTPGAPTIPDTTPLGALVATVVVTMSDRSPFTGTLTFGPPNFDDGAVYALTTPDGATSLAPNGSAVLANGGTWSWGAAAPGRPGEFFANLNGTQTAGIGDRFVVANGGNLYLFATDANLWFVWINGAFQGSAAPPTPTAGALSSAIIVNPMGPGVGPNPGTIVDHINLLATQGAKTPVVTVSPMAPTIPSTTPLGAVVAMISVVNSDGSTFTGTLGFGPPNFDDNGTFALSGFNLIVNPAGPGVGAAGGSVLNVTVVATE